MRFVFSFDFVSVENGIGESRKRWGDGLKVLEIFDFQWLQTLRGEEKVAFSLSERSERSFACPPPLKSALRTSLIFFFASFFFAGGEFGGQLSRIADALKCEI